MSLAENVSAPQGTHHPTPRQAFSLVPTRVFSRVGALDPSQSLWILRNHTQRFVLRIYADGGGGGGVRTTIIPRFSAKCEPNQIKSLSHCFEDQKKWGWGEFRVVPETFVLVGRFSFRHWLFGLYLSHLLL